MSDSKHEDDKLAVQHLVDDAVVANSQTPQPAQTTLKKGASQGLLTETVDGESYAGP